MPFSKLKTHLASYMECTKLQGQKEKWGNMRVGIFEVGCRPVEGGDVPEPGSRPDHGRETGYITPGMSPGDRERLRAGALEFARILTSLRYVPPYHRGARHVEHFLHGRGREIILSESDVEELETYIIGGLRDVGAPISELRDTFEKLVLHDFQYLRAFRGRESQAYLSWNVRKQSHWFGAGALSTKWHAALGLYYIAYGAYLRHIGSEIHMEYRAYIYDRYNWNHEKRTGLGSLLRYIANSGQLYSVPFGAAGALINSSPVAGLRNILLPNGRPYLETAFLDDSYADEILGSLQETDGATPYDIKGFGAVKRKILPDWTVSSIPPIS